MGDSRTEAVVLGTIDQPWESPKIGWALFLYTVSCFALAAVLLRAPFGWGYLLVFACGALYHGWYQPKRSKESLAATQRLPSEIVALVDEIRKECAVKGIKVIPNTDSDHPDIVLGTDGLKISRRVCEEWHPSALRWALRENLYLYRSSQLVVLLMIVPLMPAVAVVGTSPARNPHWGYVLGALALIVSAVVAGSFIEKRNKRIQLDYAQSFESNFDAATFALSSPYFAQLDEYRGKDRSWVNTDTYENAAKHLKIKLTRPIPGEKVDV